MGHGQGQGLGQEQGQEQHRMDGAGWRQELDRDRNRTGAGAGTGAGHGGRATPSHPRIPPVPGSGSPWGLGLSRGSSEGLFCVLACGGETCSPPYFGILGGGGLLCIGFCSFARCACHSTHPSLCSHANDLLRARVELFENQYNKMQLSSLTPPQHGSPPELVPILVWNGADWDE